MNQVSRRQFGSLAGIAAFAPTMVLYTEPLMAQMAAPRINSLSREVVRLNANESPWGPCPEAAEAIYGSVRRSGCYLGEEANTFRNLQAELEGLKTSHVLPFAGSSAPLHQVVMAFTSPSRPLVTADPGYEAVERAAMRVGAEVIRVPLTKTYAHDAHKMAEASSQSGVIYVCNPNNPTGTLTSRADIEFILKNKPAGSIVLLDEAYGHFHNEDMMSDLVAADQDLIILRSFSKLYGMAGLRAGAAFGRPDLLSRMSVYSAGALPVAGMVGATASLKASRTLVPERRKLVQSIREDLSSWLISKQINFVPSVSNKIMIDVRRPGREMIEAMYRKDILVGRLWPAMPNFVRVTIGTQQEMNLFKKVFAQEMGV